jgi:hypothetical protein
VSRYCFAVSGFPYEDHRCVWTDSPVVAAVAPCCGYVKPLRKDEADTCPSSSPSSLRFPFSMEDGKYLKPEQEAAAASGELDLNLGCAD